MASFPRNTRYSLEKFVTDFARIHCNRSPHKESINIQWAIGASVVHSTQSCREIMTDGVYDDLPL